MPKLFKGGLFGGGGKSELARKKAGPHRYVVFYAEFFAACMVISYVYALISNGQSFSVTLFGYRRSSDLFMDFFNSMRDASSKSVYTKRFNVYPPLGLLIFRLLGGFLPDRLLSLANVEKALLPIDQKCMMMCVMVSIACLLLFMKVFFGYIDTLGLDRSGRRDGKLLSMLMIMSYPTLYCVERGNIFLLCFVCTAFFVFFYRSKNKLLRELALISLALAAGIKYYPAAFGLMLLFDKKYKEALRAVVYGVLAVVIPALFFLRPGGSGLLVISASAADASSGSSSSGAGVFSLLLSNLWKFATEKKSRLNFSSVSVENIVYLIKPDAAAALKVTFFITEAIAFIAMFFTKKRWHRLFLISYIILNIAAASSSYALMLLTIPFFTLLFEEKSDGVFKKIYLGGFILLLVPLPTMWYFWADTLKKTAFFKTFGSSNMRPNQMLAVFVFQLMFLVVLAEIASEFIKAFIRFFDAPTIPARSGAGAAAVTAQEPAAEPAVSEGAGSDLAAVQESGDQPEAPPPDGETSSAPAEGSTEGGENDV
ncbi:MAG: glycosyltransferase 87 family protein [Clostridia bacterium]|nr:glycosyltransferase 87 family protein [Clostridia bacterium]